MKLTLTLFLALLCYTHSCAQTPKKTYKTYAWCAFGSAAIAVTSHGVYETMLSSKKQNSYLDGLGNGALFLTGAFTVAAIADYTVYKQKEKGLSLQINPTGFNLAYKF